MRKVLLGLVLGLLLAAPSAEALRLSKPPTISKWDESAMSVLNTWLESLWNLTNGRYELEETTTNPDGSRQGRRNEVIHYNNGGTSKLCLNTSTAPGGTTWRCDSSSLTAP